MKAGDDSTWSSLENINGASDIKPAYTLIVNIHIQCGINKSLFHASYLVQAFS